MDKDENLTISDQLRMILFTHLELTNIEDLNKVVDNIEKDMFASFKVEFNDEFFK